MQAYPAIFTFGNLPVISNSVHIQFVMKLVQMRGGTQYIFISAMQLVLMRGGTQYVFICHATCAVELIKMQYSWLI